MASEYAQIVGTLTFLAIFLLVAFPIPPLGRSFPLMIGALLMVQLDIVNTEKARVAIAANVDSILVLLGILAIAACLERVRALTGLEWLLTRGIDTATSKRWGSGHRVLVRTSFIAALGSAFISQEVWATIMTPMVLHVANRHDLPSLPLLLAVATSSSIGASCSPLGNLQNIIIANMGGFDFRDFLSKVGGAAFVALVLNTLLLLAIFHGALKGKTVIWTCAPLDRERSLLLALEDEQEMAEPKRTPFALSPADAISLLHGVASASAALAPPPPSYTQQIIVAVEDEEDEDLAVDVPYSPSSPSSSFSPPTALAAPLSTTERMRIQSDLRSHFTVAIADQQHEGAPTSSSSAASPKLLPKRQTHHPELDLSDEWARTEYIRRLQLETFHGVDMADAYINSHRLPKDSPHKFVYVQPDQYASPPLAAASVSQDASLVQLVRPPPPLRMCLPRYDPLRSGIPRPIPPEEMTCLDWLRARLPGGPRDRVLKAFFAISIGHLQASNIVWRVIMGAMIMIYLQREDPQEKGLWKKVDWARFIGFVFMIVVCQGLVETDLPLRLWNNLGSSIDLSTAGGVTLFSLFVILGSNTRANFPLALIISPMILTLSTSEERQHAWMVLAFVSSLAGNMTLWGSVVTVLTNQAAETETPTQSSKQRQPALSFLRYLCFGVPSTLLFFLVGLPIIQAQF